LVEWSNGLVARITVGMFSQVSGSRVQRFRVKIICINTKKLVYKATLNGEPRTPQPI